MASPATLNALTAYRPLSRDFASLTVREYFGATPSMVICGDGDILAPSFNLRKQRNWRSNLQSHSSCSLQRIRCAGRPYYYYYYFYFIIFFNALGSLIPEGWILKLETNAGLARCYVRLSSNLWMRPRWSAAPWSTSVEKGAIARVCHVTLLLLLLLLWLVYTRTFAHELCK